MNILILNFILSTPVDGKIIRRDTNRDTMIYNMARGFVKNGHTVTLLCADEFRPLREETNDFEVVYFKSRLSRLFKPWLLPFPAGLARYLRRHKDEVDMVLTVETFSVPTLIASAVCRDKLMIWQEMSYHQRLMRNLPSKIWHNIVMPLSIRGVLTVPQSEAARRFISGYQPAVSAMCVPHGVNDDIFRPDPDGSSEKCFVVISMLVRRKRVDRIIEKFARFVENSGQTDYRLLIVGDGDEAPALKHLAESSGVGANVEFLGFRSHDEIAAIGRHATALLVDTDRDLNMVSVSEALANGTPVLMNTVPNTSAYVTEMGLSIAKDGWDWMDLNEMIARYDEFHGNCVACRNSFTNTGCAGRLVKIFESRGAVKG